MKILVLGDSFADHSINHYSIKTWTDLLSVDHAVTNSSLSGSNLIYTYEKFCELNDGSWDRIIVAVTRPGRLEISKRSQILINRDVAPLRQVRFIPNLRTLEYMRERQEYKNNRFAQLIFETSRNYLALVQHEENELIIHDLLLEKLRGPNVLLIPCFDNSLGRQQVLRSLKNLEAEDNTELDYRVGHIGEEQHLKLYKAIDLWITTGNFEIPR